MTRYGEPSETAGERLTRILVEQDVSKTELARRLEALYGRKASSWRRQLVDWAADKKTIGDLNAYRVAHALGQPDDAFVTDRARPTNQSRLAEDLAAARAQIGDLRKRLEAVESRLPPP